MSSSGPSSPTSGRKGDVAIAVRGLGKAYTIRHDAPRYDTAADAITRMVKQPFRRMEKETFWALKDVSFDVKKGDVLGIIGRNGAGKSTLLKILSQITEPSKGEVNLYGRVASLLEVGTGFHPELTGRENIYLNGAILGMRKSEIDRQFDAMVDFAGTEQFLDTPVKRYSSGMYVRLAFAVAAHLNPEILLVDEVLSVGDAEFQKKCLGKMGEVATGGRTVLFVSHNMGAVASLCRTGMFLRSGQVARIGPMQEVIDCYLRGGNDDPAEVAWEPGRAPGNDFARLLAVRVLDSAGRVSGSHAISQPVHIVLDVEALRTDARLDVSIHLLTGMNTCVFAVAANMQQAISQPGIYRCTCTIPASFLNDTNYQISAFLVRDAGDVFVLQHQIVSFEVHDDGSGRDGYMGLMMGAIRPHMDWSVTPIEGPVP